MVYVKLCICGEEPVDLLYTAALFDYYLSPHYIHMVIIKNEETHKTVSSRFISIHSWASPTGGRVTCLYSGTLRTGTSNYC